MLLLSWIAHLVFLQAAAERANKAIDDARNLKQSNVSWVRPF